MLSAATTAVAAGVVHSPENFRNFVISEYQNLLRRQADTGGLNFWVSQLTFGRAPEFVEAAFVASGEYFFKSGNTPSSWILALYRDLLHRVPATFEVNFWLAQIGAGAGSLPIATAFATSGERQGIIITEVYATYLARQPEPEAVVFWLGQFQLGMDRAAFVSFVAGSTEFFFRNGGTNTGFIVGLYSDVLRRNPTPAEINFWLNIMNQLPCC
jgi:hypothetical protein